MALILKKSAKPLLKPAPQTPKESPPSQEPSVALSGSDASFTDLFSPDPADAGGKKADAFAASLVKVLRTKLKQQKSEVTNVSLVSDDSVLSAVTAWIPTGFPDIDRILGGGWPVGRCSEIFGQEGCGKSAISHMAVKSNQAQGGTPVFIDFESSLDPDKMEQLGIDPDRLIYVTPKDLEEAWDLIWETLDYVDVESQKREKEKLPPLPPTLIVWDSVAAAIPRAEAVETSSAKSHVGEVARAMSKGCRKMFRRIAQVNAHMMWINQERDKIGGFSGFGDNKTTTGGAAVRYAATLRCRVVKVETLKDGTRATGYRVKIATKKNRCAPPHQSSTWILDFKVGPSPHLTALYHLLESKPPIIKSAGGGTYVAPWSKLTFKKSEWIRILKTSPEFAKGAFESYRALMDRNANATGEEDDGEDQEES